jgi:hypothetical protein
MSNKLILGGKARQLLHLLKTWSLSAISLAISWLPNSLPEENLDRYLETLPFETSIEAQTHVNVAKLMVRSQITTLTTLPPRKASCMK